MLLQEQFLTCMGVTCLSTEWEAFR